MRYNGTPIVNWNFYIMQVEIYANITTLEKTVAILFLAIWGFELSLMSVLLVEPCLQLFLL
jgi:hypothetical protein